MTVADTALLADRRSTTLPRPDDASTPSPRVLVARRGRGDNVFHIGTTLSGTVVLAVMAGVGLFLSYEALDAFRARGFKFFTTSKWEPDTGEFGVAAVIGFTILIAAVAVSVATPLAVAVSLFITEVAPPRVRSLFVAMVDLMAAVPSVVYGLWGAYVLQGYVIPVSRWINTWLGWMPWFSVDNADPGNPLGNNSVYSASTFIAGVVVAMMVLPIQCAVMREVFSQVPPGEREGAYALGSTRWGMIQSVSLPFGKSGMIGGTMLGLGRALGETIAVVLIISPSFDFTFNVLQAGSNSVSALVALRYSEASPFGLSALMAAGLALFAMTLVVNFIASGFVARARSGASSEA